MFDNLFSDINSINTIMIMFVFVFIVSIINLLYIAFAIGMYFDNRKEDRVLKDKVDAIYSRLFEQDDIRD